MFPHASFHPKVSKMNKNCPVCNLQFETEPGFYWGAMYFSYALNVAKMVTIAILAGNILNDPGPWTYVGILVAAIFLLMPWTFRYARVLMPSSEESRVGKEFVSTCRSWGSPDN